MNKMRDRGKKIIFFKYLNKINERYNIDKEKECLKIFFVR